MVLLGCITWVRFDAIEARAATTAFTYGSGAAQATSFDIDVNDGGANAYAYFGQAATTYESTEAAASAANVNVPLAGLVGALQVCSQPAPSVPLPRPLAVDTATDGDTAPLGSSDSSAAGLAGDRSVQATPGSRAAADDTLSNVKLSALVNMTGGQSSAEVLADPASMSRSAEATSDISSLSLLGGAVRLGGMRWQISQSKIGADSRTHRVTTAEAFTMSDISVGSVSIPVSSPAQLPGAAVKANSLLAPLGLALRLPVFSSSPSGMTLSPLTIEVGGSKALWGPLVGTLLGNPGVAAGEKALEGTLFDPTNCDELDGLLKSTGQLNVYWNFFGAAAPLAIGILGQALSGSGGIDFQVGGVSTSLDDTYYPAFSFGSAVFVAGRAAGSPLTSAQANQTTTPEAPPAAGGKVTSHPASGPGPVPVRSVSASPSSTVKVLTRCETTSPAGQPSCWLGQAAVGAAATGGAVIAFLAADVVYCRRRDARLRRAVQ